MLQLKDVVTVARLLQLVVYHFKNLPSHTYHYYTSGQTIQDYRSTASLGRRLTGGLCMTHVSCSHCHLRIHLKRRGRGGKGRRGRGRGGLVLLIHTHKRIFTAPQLQAHDNSSSYILYLYNDIFYNVYTKPIMITTVVFWVMNN